jgi:cysteine-rich repeat protein
MAIHLKSALTAGLLLMACGQPDPVNLQTGIRICEPDALIECKCPNTSPGLKRCNADGSGFEECRISDTQACTETTIVKDAGPPVNKCGNGKVDPGEACDDGNKADGDLCSSLCLPKGDPVAAGTCPGMPVHLWDSEVIEASANTVSYMNTHMSDTVCNVSRGLFGTDRVFAVTAHKAGTLHVETSAASYDVVLFVRKVCADITTPFTACANAHTGEDFAAEQLDTPIANDETLYVIVDGGAIAETGDTQIRFSIR